VKQQAPDELEAGRQWLMSGFVHVGYRQALDDHFGYCVSADTQASVRRNVPTTSGIDGAALSCCPFFA
jgi:hypothetical protein